MINVCGGVGTGKTRELVRIAAENNAVIVCDNVKKMSRKVHDYGYVGLKIITHDDYLMGDTKGPFVIDKVEKVLELLAPDTLAFTSTQE